MRKNSPLPPGPPRHDERSLDLTTHHHDGRQCHQQRPWSQLTSITLHQTGTLLGEDPRRWQARHTHLGITRAGCVLLVCPLTRVVWHASGLNAGSIGLAIDGYFEGVEGQPGTLFPRRRPLTPTQEQIESARRIIGWLVNTVHRHGGHLQFLHARRQSHALRRADPGSFLWREVGLWAQRELGLSDGGRRFALGTGRPVPEVWDRSRRGIAY